MTRAAINVSSRRRRRRRSPRPFALLLIVGGISLIGYTYWPAAESGSEQPVLPTTRTPSSQELGAPSDSPPATAPLSESPQAKSPPAVTLLSESPTEVPASTEGNSVTNEPNLDLTADAGPNTEEPEQQNPVPPTVPPAVSDSDNESVTKASPAVRQRALADFSSGMRLLKDGLGVEGRQRLSDALASGGLDRTRAEEVRDILSELSETLVFGSGVAQRDPFSREFIVPKGGVLGKIAQNQTNGLHWKFIARINGISRPSHIRSGQRLKLIEGPFHVVVDKSDYRLDLWMGPKENRVYVRSFDVGIGRDNRTPEGQFQVSSRVENPQHTDPETGKVFDKDDPLNPVGEHWIAIKGTEPATEKLLGFGLHGTIEENSIGRSESLGCVRMLPYDIALLYEVMGPGRSEVLITP